MFKSRRYSCPVSPIQDKKKNYEHFAEKQIYSYLFTTLQTLFSSIKPRFDYIIIFKLISVLYYAI